MTELPILNENPNGRPFPGRGPSLVRITIPVTAHGNLDALEHDDTIDVFAYPTDTPGLVVQRALEPNADEWHVTHVPTGRWIPMMYDHLQDLDTARRLATALGPVMDWTRPSLTEDEVQRTKEIIGEFVETICSACAGTGDLWNPAMDCGSCDGSGVQPTKAATP